MIGWTAIYVANKTATQAAKGFSFVLYVDHSHHLYIEGTTLNQSQFSMIPLSLPAAIKIMLPKCLIGLLDDRRHSVHSS